jgi:endonuclease/exonuclease/phosphatase family metal-dependent hydrolase
MGTIEYDGAGVAAGFPCVSRAVQHSNPIGFTTRAQVPAWARHVYLMATLQRESVMKHHSENSAMDRSKKQFCKISTILLIAATLIALCMSGCAGSLGSAPPSFTVMTFNIHHGEGTDRVVDTQRIARLIREQHADIVALQEIDRGTARVNGRDILRELADETGMISAFGRTIDFQGGEYGVGILTRFPILRERQTLFKETSQGEQRGVLQMVLDIHGTEVVVMNTHLDDRREQERRAAAEELIQFATQYEGKPILLCGDFNSEPESRPILRLREQFDDAWTVIGKKDDKTFPSEHPNKTIDYLFCRRGSNVVPLNMSVISTNVSDHCPVIGEFVIRR